MEAQESFAGRISIKGKNLRTKLRVIASLLFVQPFMVVSYILYREKLFSSLEYLCLFFFALFVILGGMFILRETFDKFIMLASLMKKAETGEAVKMDIQKDTAELREISLSFNRIVEQLQEASRKLDAQTGELKRTLAERNHAENELRKLNEELEQRIGEKTKELLKTQKEMARNEKLALLGQLAGTVGHELRNPLGVVNNALYYLKTIIPETDVTLREYLGIIKSEIDYSQRTVSDLLEFSRVKTPKKKPIAVSDLVNQGLLKCVIPGNIVVHIDLPEGLAPVDVDHIQMTQVFHNLITNGIQAMPDGGTLRISAKIVSGSRFQVPGAEEQKRALDVESAGGFIEISVSDTGIGISPENVKTLFEPLFTTKARGIGLGLAVSKKLAEANSGTIKAESQPGVGTTFAVSLPVAGADMKYKGA